MLRKCGEGGRSEDHARLAGCLGEDGASEFGQPVAELEFLEGGRSIAVAEEGTVTWYAFKVSDTTFGIFDTFETEDARQAHLTGEIPKALGQVAPDLLAKDSRLSRLDQVSAISSVVIGSSSDRRWTPAPIPGTRDALRRLDAEEP